jgi:hypothetical protein
LFNDAGFRGIPKWVLMKRSLSTVRRHKRGSLRFLETPEQTGPWDLVRLRHR